MCIIWLARRLGQGIDKVHPRAKREVSVRVDTLYFYGGSKIELDVRTLIEMIVSRINTIVTYNYLLQLV